MLRLKRALLGNSIVLSSRRLASVSSSRPFFCLLSLSLQFVPSYDWLLNPFPSKRHPCAVSLVRPLSLGRQVLACVIR